eukprot:scaffold355337_cov36-Prasinocladus_malaysianus.AAC.1
MLQILGQMGHDKGIPNETSCNYCVPWSARCPRSAELGFSSLSISGQSADKLPNNAGLRRKCHPIV